MSSVTGLSQMEIPAELAEDAARIASATDAESLIQELSDALKLTVKCIIKMALIVERLDDLGVEITVATAMHRDLRLVAGGQLSPLAYLQFQDRPVVMRKIRTLPMSDQVRMANDESVELVMPDGDMKMKRLREMVPLEVEQAFARGEIRNPSQQRSWLDARALRALDSEEVRDVVEIDRKKKGIHVRKPCFLTREELAQYVSSLMVGGK